MAWPPWRVKSARIVHKQPRAVDLHRNVLLDEVVGHQPCLPVGVVEAAQFGGAGTEPMVRLNQVEAAVGRRPRKIDLRLGEAAHLSFAVQASYRSAIYRRELPCTGIFRHVAHVLLDLDHQRGPGKVFGTDIFHVHVLSEATKRVRTECERSACALFLLHGCRDLGGPAA
jgi:hypothetical protein